jgi:hypothetical protein
MMEAAGSSETVVQNYVTKRFQNPEYHILDFDSREIFIAHKWANFSFWHFYIFFTWCIFHFLKMKSIGH